MKIDQKEMKRSKKFLKKDVGDNNYELNPLSDLCCNVPLDAWNDYYKGLKETLPFTKEDRKKIKAKMGKEHCYCFIELYGCDSEFSFSQGYFAAVKEKEKFHCAYSLQKFSFRRDEVVTFKFEDIDRLKKVYLQHKVLKLLRKLLAEGKDKY